MKNCILINSFTNTKEKLELLYKQIQNVKKTNFPIILCSGCNVPEDILNKVDYFILNKEKIIRPASFQKKCWENKLSYIAAYYYFMSDYKIILFNDSMDLTVSKNTKLLFNTAKFFGFENAVYLDYDNLFIDTNKYLNEHFEILENGQYKSCFVSELVNTSDITSNIFHMTHFFSNINFFIDHFKYPINEVELHDKDILNTINPWQMYEMSVYKSFVNFYDKIYHIDKKYSIENIDSQSDFKRHDNINYTINQSVRFFRNLNTNNVHAIVINSSSKLNLGVNIKTYTNNICNYTVFDNFYPSQFYITEKLNIGDSFEVEIKINDTKLDNETYTKKITYNDEDSILAYVIS